MLGLFLLIFVILLMLLFVIASFFISKQQTSNSNGNELNAGNQSIIQQYDNKVKSPK
ncbi:hypothetical protein ACFVR1_00525 [Psychrobacillus sp. NPDC058041]|uniref:hypothetical protein n=1 Tax=Psychrobacillus sp. NPDC058041 TaxID=3346310 RepID=UPI0036DE928E